MPTRADSKLDLVRGFGLDVPDEAEEEQKETEFNEEDVMETLEEEPMLAEVSHIAVTGADDSIRKTITTAAQSRVHALLDALRLAIVCSLITPICWWTHGLKLIETGKLKGKVIQSP